MTDDTATTAEAPSPPPRRPRDLHPALTEERLAAARLLARGRADTLALADPWAGDDAWSVGCRAYAFSKHQMARAAESGRYPWLGVLDETHHFIFLVEGVPVRFYRGDTDDPSKRTLRQQESEAEQLALALGGDGAEGLMFRLAVETGADRSVRRIVFLALRGEEGRVECFWPMPLGDAPEPAANGARRNSGGGLQLPLAPVSPSRPCARVADAGASGQRSPLISLCEGFGTLAERHVQGRSRERPLRRDASDPRAWLACPGASPWAGYERKRVVPFV